MVTIIGLGNPGEQYRNTRHNVGRIVLDAVRSARGFSDMYQKKTWSTCVSAGVIEGSEVEILYPTTYMNESGGVVAHIKGRIEKPEDLIVVHDEIEMALGEIQIVQGRGAGGHNGVSSIINVLGHKNFVRVRIGVAKKSFFGNRVKPKKEKLSGFVLADFSKRDIRVLEDVGKQVDEALGVMLKDGVEKAMNQFN